MATSLPRNAEVADQFDLLADLLELEGAESFRVLAYRRAAQRMRETSSSIAQLALDGKAKSLSGIGKTIEEKIVQIVETGEIEALAKRRDSVPADVVRFMRLPGLGPKTAARIWRELGVTTLDELRAAAQAERLRELAGLGARTEERILKALADDRPREEFRPLLGVGRDQKAHLAAGGEPHRPLPARHPGGGDPGRDAPPRGGPRGLRPWGPPVFSRGCAGEIAAA